ncbi:hypothetical protein PCC7424_1675 [Gloeothece citriformis PCC 7424]|uniref:Uncharacterized protein n=1 Tax=Gloeothece citriformis (strain PCC 7424) TaxID=65393 RepID=B7KB02_GLOC7|nr:hypothetical protein [Gloeothece citriformis]ACK70112.1 hypothetical protein PCC7424_1675 [Gloeothece citriformis PCC 7424]
MNSTNNQNRQSLEMKKQQNKQEQKKLDPVQSSHLKIHQDTIMEKL